MRVRDVKWAVKDDRDKYYCVETNVTLYDNQIESFRFPITKNYFENLEKYGPAIASFLSKLKNVRGIEHLFISTFEVSVHMTGLNYISEEIRKAVEDFIYLCAKMEVAAEPNELLAELEIPEDKNSVIVDLNVEIVKTPFLLIKNKGSKKLVGLNVRLRKFLKALLEIPGVISVDVSYYKVTVNHAPLFDKIAIAQSITEEFMEFIKK